MLSCYEEAIANMKKILVLLFASLLLLIPRAGAAAQGAPEPINDALDDLSQRVGRTLTLNDLYWSWERLTFPDASLGCPQPGMVYAQVQVVGYRFLFTYQGQIYDYRVSDDRQIVILCSVTDEDADEEEDITAPLRDDEIPYTNPLCPAPPEGITYMRTRLAPSVEARVASALPSAVRDAPRNDAFIVAEIPGGGRMEIVEGPTCDETGSLWWQIDASGLTGYIAEGRAGEYFVEPVSPLPLPAERNVISPDATLIDFRLQGNFAPALAFAAAGPGGALSRLVIAGRTGSEGAWVYDLDALDRPPRIVPANNRLTTVDFGDQTTIVLLGGVDGGIRLWDIDPNAVVRERAFLRGHANPVTATAFRADGLVASTGGLALLSGDEATRMYAISLWDTATVSLMQALRGHTAEVIDMDFRPNSRELVSVSDDRTLRGWSLETEQARLNIDLPTVPNSLSLNASGSAAALALSDGSVHLVDLDSGALQTLMAPANAIAQTVSFNPQNDLLVFAGSDGVVYALDTADDDAVPRVIADLDDAVIALAFSPDGTIIAAMTEARAVYLLVSPGGAVG